MLLDVLLVLAGCVVVVAMIAANAFFVAQEFAYMSVDRNRLRALEAEGDRASSRALKVTDRTSFMLSGAQLGITVTGLVVGYVAEPLVGQSLGRLLGGIGVPAALSISVTTVLVLVGATVIQMVCAELFPKNYAIANPLPLARWLASPTVVYLRFFGWLIWFFDLSANLLLKMLRITPVHDVDSSATSQDLEHIAHSSRRAGHLPQHLYLTVDRVLDFPEHTVEHAMIPRPLCGTVTPETSIAEVREKMSREHTRYPVMDAEDELLGVVHLPDLLIHADQRGETAQDMMRQPLIVPTAMPLPEALSQLEHTSERLACVIDEYGGFAGIITLEDLAEEVFGEITDEHDPAESTMITAEGPDVWMVDGRAHLDEVERALGHELPSGDYETLSGLLLATAGRLLDAGESLSVELPLAAGLDPESEPHRLHATVLSVQRRIPHEVRLRLVAPRPAADSPQGAES